MLARSALSPPSNPFWLSERWRQAGYGRNINIMLRLGLTSALAVVCRSSVRGVGRIPVITGRHTPCSTPAHLSLTWIRPLASARAEMSGGGSGKNRHSKRARVGSGADPNVPPEKRKAIIEARKNNDAKAALDAVAAILSEDLSVPVDLATIALSCVVENADQIPEGGNALETINTVYDQLKAGPATEAFFSTASRVFLRLGSFERGLQVISEMKAAGHTPRHRTFSPVLAKACESNDHLATARSIYKEMTTAQSADLLFEDDASVILEACARIREQKSGTASSSSVAPGLTETEAIEWAEEVMRDCARRATEPPSERLIKAAVSFFVTSRGKEAPKARELDAEHRCQSCGVAMRSVEPDEAQLELVLKQTEALAPLQTPKKKEEWDVFVQWEQRHMHKYDTVVDGANISYFRASSNADSEPRYDQADLVMKKLKEMGRKPLLFFHARHFNKKGVSQELTARWKSEQSLFIVPHGHNDDVFWLHMSIKMGPRNWMVTNDQMRDHRFEMFQSTNAFARWRERHQTAYEVLWNDQAKKLEVAIFPPIKYSVQIQNSESGKWHLPVRIPPTPEEAKAAEEKVKLKAATPQELRQLLAKGKITFEAFREVRRETLGCELPKNYGKKFEWLCLEQ